MKVRCPNLDCGLTYNVQEEQLGRRVKCETCETRFTISANQGKAAGETRGESEATMPLASVVGEVPKTLGGFEIRAKLGTGAFGTVYRAHDPQLDREVALKVPHPDRVRDEKFVKRFLNEAKAAARLQHPNIVPVFGAGKDAGHYYIAAAFIDGDTLDADVQESPTGFRETARIVMQLAEALAYAHKQGIVHRDVKPPNVMLDRNGEPHLMDFGLARLSDDAEKLTQDGSVLGTPAYMPRNRRTGSGITRSAPTAISTAWAWCCTKC